MEKIAEIIKIIDEAIEKLKPYHDGQDEAAFISYSLAGTLQSYASMIEESDQKSLTVLTYMMRDFLLKRKEINHHQAINRTLQ